MQTRPILGPILHWSGTILSLALVAATPASVDAQQFHTLHSFSVLDSWPKNTTLVPFGSALYGTTLLGGNSNAGTVYSINLDGTNFQSYQPPSSAATEPQSLTLLNSKLYGVTVGGAPPSLIFSVTPGMSDFQPVHAYTTANNIGFQNGLTPIGSQLFGTTTYTNFTPPQGFEGVAFSMNADGTSYHILHTFLNGDIPSGNLIQNGTTLYGYTTFFDGEVYSMGLNGSNFQVVHAFNQLGLGLDPQSLSLIGSMFYGTTLHGGTLAPNATIFAMNQDGSSYHLLHSFDDPGLVRPTSGLVLADTRLYGTAELTDGNSGTDLGFVYSLNPDGTGYRVVHAFDNHTFDPSPLTLVGNTLYGTTLSGGDNGWGSVYEIVVPEPSSLALALLAALTVVLGGATASLRRDRSTAVGRKI